MQIKVNRKDYKIEFGFKANRILAEMWNLKTFGQVMQKVQKELLSAETGDVTFDQYNILSQIALAGIKSVDVETKITADDLVEVLFKSVDVLTDVMKMYIESLPKAPPAPKNAKRGQKKK